MLDKLNFIIRYNLFFGAYKKLGQLEFLPLGLMNIQKTPVCRTKGDLLYYQEAVSYTHLTLPTTPYV